MKEALERHKADGSEPINVAKLTGRSCQAARVEEAEKEKRRPGDPLPSVTRITGDVRDSLGVKQAKAEAVAGGADPANVENIIGNVDGMLERYDPQIGTILEKVPPLQDSVTRDDGCGHHAGRQQGKHRQVRDGCERGYRHAEPGAGRNPRGPHHYARACPGAERRDQGASYTRIAPRSSKT